MKSINLVEEAQGRALLLETGFRRGIDQAILAGRDYVMLPTELLPTNEAIEPVWADLYRRGICGAVVAAQRVSWVCLKPSAPVAHDAELGGALHGAADGDMIRVVITSHDAHPEDQAGHGWPGHLERARAEHAFLEQTDPVARLERRAMYELAQEGLIDPDYAAGMLRAGALEETARG